MNAPLIRICGLVYASLWLTTAISAQTPLPPAVNPALLYWQSIGMLTEMNRGEMQLLHGHRNGKELEVEKAAELVGNQKPTIARFIKASKSTAPCDWGFTMEEGPFMPLPHLGKMQTLCNLVLMKAGVDFVQGDTEDALEAIFAVRRAARHLGDGNLLVAALAQYTMESQALAALGEQVLRLDESTRVAYLAHERTLPTLRTAAQAIKGERGFVSWVERQATEVVGLMLLQKMAEQKTNAAESPPTNPKSTPDGPSIPASSSVSDNPYATLTPELLDTWIAEVRARYDEAAVALALPWPESQIAVKSLEDRLKQSNPLVQSIFPSLKASRDTQARTETQCTMLEAALQHGPGLDESTIAGYRDAFEGKPLQLRREPNGGLTLLSVQKVRGREVQLKLAAPPVKR